MEQLRIYRATLIARAEAVVGELAEAIAVIPAGRWVVPLRKADGSPHAVMAHLRDVEAQAYFVRLRRILEEESPWLPTFDPVRWQREHYAPGAESMEAILGDYARIREEELALMRRMTPAQWSRSGRHDQFGLRTAQWWVERMVAHALEHLDQLRAG